MGRTDPGIVPAAAHADASAGAAFMMGVVVVRACACGGSFDATDKADELVRGQDESDALETVPEVRAARARETIGERTSIYL